MNAPRRTLLALLGITAAGVASIATPVASFAAEPAMAGGLLRVNDFQQTGGMRRFAFPQQPGAFPQQPGHDLSPTQAADRHTAG